MIELQYVTGDATLPQGEGPKVICHCCNDEGGWGSGFVVALSKRWKNPEQCYRRWSNARVLNPIQGVLWAKGPGIEEVPFELGQVIFVQVEPDIWVANIIGQHRTIKTEPQPVRYRAIEEGLLTVGDFCKQIQGSAHMPRLGAGLARGDWDIIEGIVEATLVNQGINVTVYDLP